MKPEFPNWASKRLSHFFLAANCVLLGCNILLCTTIDAHSLSSSGIKDDPWNPHHIDLLPVEIQRYIAAICKGAPAAQHDFATYLPQERRWRINLEYLRCEGLGKYYRRDGQCLDVDFVKVGPHFRLVRKDYRDCGF